LCPVAPFIFDSSPELIAADTNERGRGVILVDMKRKLIIAGICFGLLLAAIVVVLLTRQDVPQTTAPNPIRVTQSGQLMLEPQGGQGSMTLIAHLPDTNNVKTATMPK
jgi:hypothetical protein